MSVDNVNDLRKIFVQTAVDTLCFDGFAAPHTSKRLVAASTLILHKDGLPFYTRHKIAVGIALTDRCTVPDEFFSAGLCDTAFEIFDDAHTKFDVWLAHFNW